MKSTLTIIFLMCVSINVLAAITRVSPNYIAITTNINGYNISGDVDRFLSLSNTGTGSQTGTVNLVAGVRFNDELLLQGCTETKQIVAGINQSFECVISIAGVNYQNLKECDNGTGNSCGDFYGSQVVVSANNFNIDEYYNGSVINFSLGGPVASTVYSTDTAGNGGDPIIIGIASNTQPRYRQEDKIPYAPTSGTAYIDGICIFNLYLGWGTPWIYEWTHPSPRGEEYHVVTSTIGDLWIEPYNSAAIELIAWAGSATLRVAGCNTHGCSALVGPRIIHDTCIGQSPGHQN